MIVRLRGTIDEAGFSSGDEIEVVLTHDDYGRSISKSREEQIINDLAAQLARKLIAAKVA